MVEIRVLLAVVAVVTSVLVLFNLSGAMKLITMDESSVLVALSPEIQRVSTPFRNVKGHQRSLLLIHVGKTGGETVRHTLKITCRMRKNPIQQQTCWDTFPKNATESFLSRHTIGILHCDLLLPKNSLERATTLLWTLRNPLDRVVSWYHYMNPANCRPLEDYYSTACNTNRSISRISRQNFETNDTKKKGSKWVGKFFVCFPTIDQFANALLPGDNVSYCSQLAWRTITGEASKSSGHVYFNYNYYWNETMMKYPNKELWVLRTESLWEDMMQIEEQLTSNRSVSHSHHFAVKHNVTHGSEGHLQRDRLSIVGRARLCCALRDEITKYGYILERSTNLDMHEKNRSLFLVLDQCRVAIDVFQRNHSDSVGLCHL